MLFPVSGIGLDLNTLFLCFAASELVCATSIPVNQSRYSAGRIDVIDGSANCIAIYPLP